MIFDASCFRLPFNEVRSRAVAGELGALVRRRMFGALIGCRLGVSVRSDVATDVDHSSPVK